MPCSSWQWRKTSKPSGKFLLSLIPIHYTGDVQLRQNWKDGKKKIIESYLNDFIVGLIRAAAAQRAQRNKWDLSSAESTVESLQRKRKEEIAKHKADRDSKLMSAVSRWEESVRIRSFTKHAREKVSSAAIPDTEKVGITKWLDWADNKAERANPISDENIRHLGDTIKAEDSNIFLRPAVEEDYPSINNLLKSSSSNPEDADDAIELLNNLKKNNAFDIELSIVAMNNTELIGYILLSEIGIEGLPGKCGVAVAPFCIAEKYRNRGIGTFIIKEAINKCRELNKDFISVQGNPEFFKRFGFETNQPCTPTEDTDNPTELVVIPNKDISSCGGTLEYPQAWTLDVQKQSQQTAPEAEINCDTSETE